MAPDCRGIHLHLLLPARGTVGTGMTDRPASGLNNQTGIAPASSGRGEGDAPFYIYRQVGMAASMPEAEALAREQADWDRIEIRSGCGELVAVLNKGKWHNTLAGIRPTYNGGNNG